MCNGIEKIKCMLMKCHTNVNSTAFTQLPHKFSYIVAILGHNHFESPNTTSLKGVFAKRFNFIGKRYSYLRYKCKKLSFIARTGLKYDRGTSKYLLQV
jgi:hypothetical protein